ncbi:glycoside hydrolase family 88 protein [Kribbella sp. NPDC005582]|uniref:glycoside hydrolase family 88 protein n=1 Tax=Kribbella sp. NPDC005582 TaxID=3156893 RepID=UPI0033BA4B3C
MRVPALRRALAALLSIPLLATSVVALPTPAQAEVQHPRQQFLRDSVGGLFLHWGMRTSPGYTSCSGWENAVTAGGWDPAYWVREAQKLHTQYLVLATFHSRLGYARPWPSAIPGSCHTGRDLVRETIDAASAQGLKVILYMTDDPQWHADGLPDGKDWLDSAAYSKYKGRSVDLTTRDGFGEFSYDNFVEVMQRYPDLGGFWIDNDNAYWERNGLYERIRRERPSYTLSNNNEDTPIMDMISNEQKTGMSPAYDYPQAVYTAAPRLIEADFKLPSTGAWWYGGSDPAVDPALTIGRLVSNAGSSIKALMAETAMVNGRFPAHQESFNNLLDKFLRPIWPSIAGTEGGGYLYGGLQPGFWNDGAHGVTTISRSNPDEHYLHVLTRPSTSTLRIRDNGYRVARVTNLRTGAVIPYSQARGVLTLTGISSWDQYDTVFKVETAGREGILRAPTSAPAAADGSYLTFWDTNKTTPVSLRYDLGSARPVRYLGINQREDSVAYARSATEQSARIKDYRVYASADGTNWGAPIKTGTLPSRRGVAFIDLPATSTRYLRLEVLNTHAASSDTTRYKRLRIDETWVGTSYARAVGAAYDGSRGTASPYDAGFQTVAGYCATDSAQNCPEPLLDNGLARTPPMGFNNWNSTKCSSAFNEAMIKSIADLFVSRGLKDAGYQYVNIDDCWALPQRNAQGNLVPDPARFPNGIKSLADYVHGKGLKFGIYTSAGTKTCNTAGFPGGLGHEQQDANLFASWGVDYLKYDNCNNQGVDAQQRYKAMRDALLNTGRPITYSICEWGRTGPPPVWVWGKDVGNLWRTTGDISDNWTSMIGKAQANRVLAQYAGPGHWNDPDMLEVGNGGMTATEYRTHLSLWAMMSAPLLIGTDLRKASAETFDLLTNHDVIAVDQDKLGRQGTVVSSSGGLVVYGKTLANGDRAVALSNETGSTATISTTTAALGLGGSSSYTLKDLWSKAIRNTTGSISASVPAHATVLYRVSRAGSTTRYEAEAAAYSGGSTVDTDHSGFSGNGFVNTPNTIGSYVQWTVNSSQPGPATLTFDHANGTTANRAVDIAVNGMVVARNVAVPTTGAWTLWRTLVVNANLTAGSNTVRVTATTADGAPNLDYLDVTSPPSAFAPDWSVAMVDSTMARYQPATIGGWSYPVGLYLYGQYLVYERTKNPKYLTYLKSWVDRFVDSSGNITNSFNNLDSMLSGRLLVLLHHETGDNRYKIAATKIRTRLDSYPRTADGGFWHATSRQHQLWGDGVFMVDPFLAEYGREFGDSTYTSKETVSQLLTYASHLQQPNGLLRHAYDEARTQSWADPKTGLSPEVWCRAEGWYGMAVIDVLEAAPADQPRRAELIDVLRRLVAAYAHYQDPKTGRWFQVVDKGGRSDNWTETSCSSMYTFVISRAVQRGYVAASYQTVADRGYQGVLAKISLGSDGRTNLKDISVGTNVGDYAYYAGRTRATNDFHGLGAFLIMNEQFHRTVDNH